MSSVLNLLYLIAFLFLGTLYFFGLGWIFLSPMLHRSLFKAREEILSLQSLALALICGLITNYLIVLIVHSLVVSLILGLLISIFGIISFCVSTYYSRRLLKAKLRVNPWTVGAVIYSLLIIAPILVDPLVAWDARSFWFFHGKIIFMSGVFDKTSGWLPSVVGWSHLDYPKLVPVISAQITHIAGYWNEFLPKLSLFFMWLPVNIWLFPLGKKTFSFLFLLLVIPFPFYPYLWNGYMDALVAAYFTISLIAFVRYFSDLKIIDFLSAICCLLLIINIKNEGYLLFISEVVILLFAIILYRSKHYLRIKFSWVYIPGLIAGISPPILWEFYKHDWSFANDLALGTTGFFLRIATRISDGSLKMILQSMITQMAIPLIIFISLLLLLVIFRIKIQKIVLIALLPAVIYFLGIFVIYLATPAQVEWHLATSVDRTMFAVNGAVFVACYYFLIKLEESLFKKKSGNEIDGLQSSPAFPGQ